MGGRQREGRKKANAAVLSQGAKPPWELRATSPGPGQSLHRKAVSRLQAVFYQTCTVPAEGRAAAAGKM